MWPTLTKIAIDHAVAEPAAADGRVAVVPARFGWDDVGDFASLSALLPGGAEPVQVLGDGSLVVSRDSTGSGRPRRRPGGRGGRARGCRRRRHPDAVLVVAKNRAQDVKAVVDSLTGRGRADLT